MTYQLMLSKCDFALLVEKKNPRAKVYLEKSIIQIIEQNGRFSLLRERLKLVSKVMCKNICCLQVWHNLCQKSAIHKNKQNSSLQLFYSILLLRTLRAWHFSFTNLILQLGLEREKWTKLDQMDRSGPNELN